MLANTDVHVTAIRRSFGKDHRGETVPAFEIHFSIRGQGDFTASVPIATFSAEKGMVAVKAVAEPIVELLDAFPGK